MVIDRAANEAARIYSSDPVAYPVKGRKPLGQMTDWGAQVLDQGQPYIGYNADDIRSAFFDHETIARLGCASVLNLPVFSGGLVIGTVNLLHEESWYRPEHARRGAPFATLLAPSYLAWAAG
ncbi:MAG: GAF domain-containing protein [Geminicoccaceae bacterium]